MTTDLPFIPASPEQKLLLIAWKAQIIEQCALICEAHGVNMETRSDGYVRYEPGPVMARKCAAAIRAQEQK